MGAISGAAQILFAYKFTRLLTKPFTEWDAYKVGLINGVGQVVRRPKNAEEKAMLSVWYNLVRNLKRTLEILPGGSSRIATFAAAYALLKEKKGDKVNNLIHELYPEWPVHDPMVMEAKKFLGAGTYILRESSPFRDSIVDGKPIHVVEISDAAFSIPGVSPPVFRFPIDNHLKFPVYACESQIDRV